MMTEMPLYVVPPSVTKPTRRRYQQLNARVSPELFDLLRTLVAKLSRERMRYVSQAEVVSEALHDLANKTGVQSR